MALKLVKDMMTQDVISVSLDEPLHEILLLMTMKHISFVVVAEDRKPLGIISERTLVNFLDQGVEDNIVRAQDIMEAPTIFQADSHSDYLDAYHHLKEQGKRHLVVVDVFGFLSGVITLTDIINHLGIQICAEEKLIGSIMTASPKTVHSSELMGSVIRMMVRNKISCVVVTEHNRPVGIITERDISRHVELGEAWKQKLAKEVMSSPLKVISPNLGASQAIAMMNQFSIRHLVLVEDEVLVGVVTETDIVTSIEGAYVKNLIRILDKVVEEKTEKLNQEVKEHKEAKKKLLKLSQALEQSSESVMITDNQGRIEYVNAAFEKITGYSAQEAIGKKPSLLKSGNQDAAFYAQMWATILSGQSWKSKVVEKRKDGSFYPAILTISPVFDEEGEVVNFVGSHSDISELEEMERNFYQAQKMEAIGVLVGGIAHDFNNMLSGITGNLFLAKKKASLLPEVVQKLDNIDKLAFRAADMIAKLLTFSRKEVLQLKLVPLTSYVKELSELMRVGIPENIQFSQDICTDELQVKGDSAQLHQVLMNLINNARDALEGVDNPEIILRIEEVTLGQEFIDLRPYHITGKHFAHISISDNGCGIPKDHLVHLFEPFFTTKAQDKGTGLGLAMVYGAVKSHGGFIEAESVEGEGTTFHVYLPLVVAKDESEAKEIEEVIEGKGEFILLVDDEENIRDTISEVLENLNYQVVTAANGTEAVEVFKEHSNEVDLVILDAVMPEMGGEEAAKYILDIQPNVHVIFATGYSEGGTLSSHSQNLVIRKPYSVIELSRMLREKLNY